MVDPVGAVLGVAGLAGLFSSCVQCFELVQLGRASPRISKFANLVQDVKDLIDSLEDITKSLQMLARQQEIITAEVESITDTTSLRLLEEAFSGSENKISDAATRRLRRIDGQCQYSTQPPTLDTRLQSLSLEASFHTAGSQFVDSDNEQSLVALTTALAAKDLPQNQRVLDQYRLQSQPLGSVMSSRASAPAAIDSKLVGISLCDMKKSDTEQTKAVLRRFSHSSNPEEKRMVMILQNLLDSAVTIFVSLAPIGEDLFDLLGRIEGPPGSPYEGGVFHVRLEIPEDFP